MRYEYSARVATIGDNVTEFNVVQKVVEELIYDCGDFPPQE